MKPTILDKEGCTFTVWAPEKERMEIRINGRAVGMRKTGSGYFQVRVGGVRAGDRYFYHPDGGSWHPDPVSHYQPEGIQGASEVVDHGAYCWRDEHWKGLPLADLIFYEIHVGAFSPGGTFEGIIARLDQLAELGINAIELMPVAQFPGARNWGYDGVFLYAVQNTYGGPDGLKSLVDACHSRGIAVFLDVVYNHVGKEGNCLPFFGPYFSDKYLTPWGKALNYDGAWSDGVRDLIIGNVLHWAEHYHIDGLRLDAIHEIFDRNAIRVWDLLQERVSEWVQRCGRSLHLVAESDLNSPRVVLSPERGGYGFDAQWLDDFHHTLYVLLDEEGIKHYKDFGRPEQLARVYAEGFVHQGEHVTFRHRTHGASSAGLSPRKFVVFNQNHDLPGNRPGGERLSVLTGADQLKLAAAALLLSPYIPLLFMGEEYGEDAPFYFFSDHADEALRAEVRESRRQQFAVFEWSGDPPDPQDEQAFLQSRLQWEKRTLDGYGRLLGWYRELIRFRKAHPLLSNGPGVGVRADLIGASGLALHRHSADGHRQLLCLFNFSGVLLPYLFAYSGGRWVRSMGSGEGAPLFAEAGDQLVLPAWSVTVYDLGESSSTTLRSAMVITPPAG